MAPSSDGGAAPATGGASGGDGLSGPVNGLAGPVHWVFLFFIIFLIQFTEAGAKPPRLMTLLTVTIPRRRLPSPPPKTFFARAPIMFCVVVWSVKRFWYTNVLL